MNKRPTIKDIAKELGVTATTVSLGLRDDPRLPEKTISKVKEMAKKLNYRPNVQALALVANKSSFIGLVIPNVLNSFFPSVITGIQNEIEEKGYSLILCHTGEDAKKEEKHLNTLLDKQVEGLIVYPVGDSGTNTKIFKEIERQEVPLVTIGNPKEKTREFFVKFDNYAGGYLAGKHLLGLGHVSIVFITPTMEILEISETGRHDKSNERFLGLTRLMQSEGKEKSLKVIDNPLEDLGDQIVDKIMSLKPQPTAILAYSDLLALKTIRHLTKRGFKVPEDFSVMGFDDIPIASLSNPTLSTIHLSKSDMGKMSGKKIIDLIEGKRVMHTVLEPELIVRESTTAPHQE